MTVAKNVQTPLSATTWLRPCNGTSLGQAKLKSACRLNENLIVIKVIDYYTESDSAMVHIYIAKITT